MLKECRSQRLEVMTFVYTNMIFLSVVSIRARKLDDTVSAWNGSGVQGRPCLRADFDDNNGSEAPVMPSRFRQGGKPMSRLAAGLVLITMILLGRPTLAHAQAPLEKPPAVDESDEFGLKPPTREELFRVQSEKSLREHLQQALPGVKKVDFPKDAPLAAVPSEIAPFPPGIVFAQGGHVCYRPLYFEAKRTERFGRYVPCVQPLLSAGRFYGDFLILPFKIVLAPPWTYKCDNR